ncbi:MAG TPA: glycosyltransferase family 4 protein [Polyangiaceae bacterium]|nr:glycosyltransferase family 4 protein [Polyangiaceae bacterium]
MATGILQSYPHKIGAGRISGIAWHQAAGVADAGGDLTVYAGVLHRSLPPSVRVHTTLARGRWRIPYRALGNLRALALHDRIVARALPQLRGRVEIVHTWPLAGLETLRTARRLGITTVVERPNAHTRFAYEVVAKECERIGVPLPANHEHAYNASKLQQEEEEYSLADYLLCPSEFVVRTFLDLGFEPERLVRHNYGFDDRVYFPLDDTRKERTGLSALFVGGLAVRKGLHFALEAWLRSPASQTGTFRVAGAFVPGYKERLAEMLAHPSVQVLGHRDDVPELMRSSDVLLLPTIEEGSPLVCMEAVASGCVPLVSEVCDAACAYGNALVHRVGDVEALSEHLTLLDQDRGRLAELRAACLAAAPGLTWTMAGRELLQIYEQLARKKPLPVSVLSANA